MLNRDRLNWLFKTSLWLLNNCVVWLLHLNKGFPVLGYYYSFASGNYPHLATDLSLNIAWGPGSSQLCFFPWSPNGWVSENPGVSTEIRKLERRSRVVVQGVRSWLSASSSSNPPVSSIWDLPPDGNVALWGSSEAMAEPRRWLRPRRKESVYKKKGNQEENYKGTDFLEVSSSVVLLKMWFTDQCPSETCSYWPTNWEWALRNLCSNLKSPWYPSMRSRDLAGRPACRPLWTSLDSRAEVYMAQATTSLVHCDHISVHQGLEMWKLVFQLRIFEDHRFGAISLSLFISPNFLHTLGQIASL